MGCKLLLATGNAGKVEEYRSLFTGLPCELVTPKEKGITASIEEVGKTLEENARLKATEMARLSNMMSLADDSGLEVDALGGEPGPLSARYAGAGASDSDRINFLLSRLKNVPGDKRTARFRCVIAIAQPGGKVETVSGECAGIITFEAKGKGGFGYDPVFYLPEWGKTMAELSPEEKNCISHRGEAARKARKVLERLIK